MRATQLIVVILPLLFCSCLERNPSEEPKANEGAKATPHGIFSVDGWILVSDPQLDFSKNPVHYGPGRVHVISSTSREVINALTTSAKNPLHFAATQDHLLVVSEGPLAFVDGRHQSTAAGAVDAFAIETLDSATQASWSIPLSEAPGNITVVGEHAYLGNAFSPRLYKLDLAQKSVLRGPDNPIEVHSETGVDTTKPALLPDGRLAVLSCNTNALFFVDPTSDEVANVRVSLLNNPSCAGKPECLECPIDMAFRSDLQFPVLYVLKSLSNHVARVNLEDNSVIADWAVVGPVANKLWLHGDNLFVVNSGANNLQRIELLYESSKTVSVFPVGASPYEGVTANERHWVTLMMAGSVASTAVDDPGAIEIISLPTP
jgi:hypothetical protein